MNKKFGILCLFCLLPLLSVGQILYFEYANGFRNLNDTIVVKVCNSKDSLLLIPDKGYNKFLKIEQQSVNLIIKFCDTVYTKLMLDDLKDTNLLLINPSMPKSLNLDEYINHKQDTGANVIFRYKFYPNLKEKEYLMDKLVRKIAPY